MHAKRPRRTRLGDVTTHFVEAAKQLPQVQRILLVDTPGEERRIWTVIDAPPSDREAERRVYQAEGDAIVQGTELVGFRLINIREFHYPVEQILPHDARVLFERGVAS